MTDAHLTASMSEQPDHGEDSYEGHGRLRDKVAVVTGGDSGIGRAVALAFAREGADLVICYLESDDEDAQETARLVRASGRSITLVPTDLTHEDACRDLVERTVAEHGRIDVLVNNAAYQLAQPGGIADITTEQFDRTMRTNLYAMFWMCKLALPHMGRGSSIINTSSVQAGSPSPELLDYATTKAGIATFTRALAWSAARDGVRVNSVAPGPTWTPLVKATMPEEMTESFGENTPMGRAGQPVEVAGAFVYLASAESAYVTGEVLAVTGGLPVTV
ncbi:SDR family oxidoreductase [Nocardioides lijunqiniae]|uniref:SDR family oxidoreductase n=1 Tax=Nocardioides lijunqiniae TaxID=2760832 RepID=UPI0030B7F795